LVRRCEVGQSQYTKHQRLVARLEDATRRLAEVERDLRAMEEGWGGSPLRVNPAQYEHDWVQFANVARARSHYLWLQQEREILLEMIRAVRRKLAEVGV
jgi:hypothetical protein